MENHPIEIRTQGQEIIFYILDEDGQSCFNDRLNRSGSDPGRRAKRSQ